MMGVNKVVVIGTLGKDPEVRKMSNGNAVVNITVAVSEKYKDKSGENKEITEWINAVFFGRLAEIVAEYCRKGSQVYFEGKLKTEKYEKEGQTHYSTKVIASNMQLLGGKPANSANSQHNKAKANGYQKQEPEEFLDDPLPF